MIQIDRMLSLRSSAGVGPVPTVKSQTLSQQRVLCVRAAGMGSMDDFNNEGVSAAAMGLLAQRIAALKNTAESKLQRAIKRRPQIPEGRPEMILWEEMRMDHELLCKWHESAWREQQQQMGQDGAAPSS